MYGLLDAHLALHCLDVLRCNCTVKGLRAVSTDAQGRTYLCKKLDLSSKVAVVRPADLKYYTKTRDFTDVHVIGGRKAYANHSVRRLSPWGIWANRIVTLD